MKLPYHRCGDYLLPDLDLTEKRTTAPWQVRQDAPELSQGAPSRPVQQPPAVRKVHGASA